MRFGNGQSLLDIFYDKMEQQEKNNILELSFSELQKELLEEYGIYTHIIKEVGTDDVSNKTYTVDCIVFSKNGLQLKKVSFFNKKIRNKIIISELLCLRSAKADTIIKN